MVIGLSQQSNMPAKGGGSLVEQHRVQLLVQAGCLGRPGGGGHLGVRRLPGGRQGSRHDGVDV